MSKMQMSLFPKIKRAIPALVFLAIAVYILMGFQDMLFTAHLRTPFICGTEFWHQLSGEPFGAMRWIGCWLTQTAYYPMLAIFIYIIMWGVGYYCLERVLHLPLRWSALTMLPFVCMFVGIVGTGYWLYVQKDWGYWFSQTVALLIMLILLYLFSQKVSQKTMVIAAVVCVAIYPIIGWYSMLMSLCLIILCWQRQRWNVLPLLVPLLSPGWWHIFTYRGVNDVTMWISGFPIFVDAHKYAVRPMMPYIAMAVIMVVLCLVSSILSNFNKTNDDNKTDWKFYVVTIVVALISIYGVKSFAFDDYNYQAEMRMSKYAMEDNWNAVIKEAQASKAPSHSMVLLKNVALLNTRQLGDRSFRLGNYVNEINNPDTIQLNSMQICSPVVYYNYGKLNYSIRWSIEFAVGYGFSPYYLMNLIRAAEGTGEKALAQRYMDILHDHLFYKDWQPLAKTEMVADLQKAYSNTLDSDSDDMETYLIRLFSNSYMSPNKTVIELSLFNSMLYRNPDNFWYAFTNYCSANQGKPLPLHYQEAYLGFMNIWPVELSFKPNINPTVQQSFDNFLRQYGARKNAGIDDKTLSEEMSQKWRGTYFWYMLFGLAPK